MRSRAGGGGLAYTWTPKSMWPAPLGLAIRFEAGWLAFPCMLALLVVFAAGLQLLASPSEAWHALPSMLRKGPPRVAFARGTLPYVPVHLGRHSVKALHAATPQQHQICRKHSLGEQAMSVSRYL